MTIQQKIPEEWKEVKLSNIGLFSKGQGISKADIIKEGNNAIRYAELYTKYNFKIEKIYSHVSNEVIKTSIQINAGNIVFAGSGETIDEIGKSAVYLIDKPCFVGGDTIIFSPKNQNGLYLSYNLNTGNTRKKLRTLGQGQSIVHIYKKDIEKITIQLPPLQEQTRIVEVLETWNKYLEQVDQKIKIKKYIKKGLMQNLLTGKKRLGGFDDKWQEKNIGKIIIPQQKTNRMSGSSLNTGKYPFFNNSSKNFDQYIDDYDFNGEMIIANTGGIAYFDYYFGKFAVMSDCFVFDTKESCKFLFYILKFFEFIINNKGFTGSGIKHLDKKFFFKFKIKLPSLKEQIVIANIFTAIDKEIEMLEKQREIVINQKKYLLNNLITGQIRLPEFVNKN